ncbi:XdhC family protein [Lysobacter panacisoli]|uniref:XdhC/CoxI family protein n=1 Tax=Lysobacter panacisoli TaxID=1255263 RepID=A0ABP9L4S3_9GAMM|nr:XdhC/CoxI family protein [Lysobacter panacisoli]
MNRAPAIVSPLATVPPGATRAVLEASARTLRDGAPATLAVVLETDGSTYVGPGALALFEADGAQTGWLSGGCLEPEIAQRAEQAARLMRIEWMEVDTRGDEDLLAGSALGCRGRLRIALLPLAALDGWPVQVDAWCEGNAPLRIAVEADGAIAVSTSTTALAQRLPADAVPWAPAQARWTIDVAPPPSILVLGAGPESTVLLPLLRALGAVTTLAERRPRWRDAGVFADRALDLTPTQALREDTRRHDIALVMHHHFELDREALEALASSPIAFIGLLGPTRRRDDLFRVLPASARESLLPRLHSPVGLHLGGRGPEAIALSIAAQLQRHLHGASA